VGRAAPLQRCRDAFASDCQRFERMPEQEVDARRLTCDPAKERVDDLTANAEAAALGRRPVRW
jgi:hypothetical protein